MLRYGGVVLLVVLMGLAMTSLPEVSAGYYPKIREGFYNGKCVQRVHRFFGLFGSRTRYVDVEAVVSGIVRRRYNSDPTIVPALLRLQFHDCFVNGCDASILLDGEGTEKTAPPNLSVRGFDLIDEIKDALEGMCPGVVSCADIIAMATRDTAYFGARNRAFWFPVETGRRDGMVSVANNTRDLPPPFASIDTSIAMFAKKKLNPVDLVYLLGGGHSVGITHCRFIQDRLSNASSTPTMNPALWNRLSTYCKNSPNNEINLDQGTPNTVDKALYTQVLHFQTGIFKGDQEMATHPATRRTVQAISSGRDSIFGYNFGRAMRKMQAVGVLTGNKGQIRATCNAIN